MRAIVIFLLAWMAFILAGCRARTIYVPINNSKTDTAYVYKLERDTAYLRDSIVVTERGDSVFTTRDRYLYREIVRRDTIYQSKTDTTTQIIQVEREFTTWEKTKMGIGLLSIIIVIVYIIIIIFLRVKKIL